MTNYRQVGEEVGAFIGANNPTTQQIQGLLADLLAGDELLQVMREVVSMPAFAALEGLTGSGGESIQRDDLLQDLGARYTPTVVDRVGQLVDGILDQATNRRADISSTASPGIEPQVSPGPEKRYAEPLQDLTYKFEQVLSELNELNSSIKHDKSTQAATPAHQNRRPEPQKEEEASGCLIGGTIVVIIIIVGALVGSLSPSTTSSPSNNSEEKPAIIEQPKAPDCDSVLGKLEAANVHESIRIYDRNKGDCMGSIFKKQASNLIFNKTVAYEDSKDSDKNIALSYYLKALDIAEPEPGDKIELYIANTLMSLKRYGDAISHLDSYISKNPKDPYGFNERGTAYGWLGNWEQSCTDNKRARDLGIKTVNVEGKTTSIEEYIANFCS